MAGGLRSLLAIAALVAVATCAQGERDATPLSDVRATDVRASDRGGPDRPDLERADVMPDSSDPGHDVAEEGARGAVLMDFDRAGGLFDAPVPSEDLRGPDGKVRLDGWPNDPGNAYVSTLLETLEGSGGFGRTSAIYLPLRGAVDPESLPTLHASIGPGASVFLTDVDASSPERGRRVPVRVAFRPDLGPFGATNVTSQ